MSLSKNIVTAYENILREELLVAMGCTEPISIAYAASILIKELGAEPEKIRVQLSGNIIKNVKSVIVPATGGLHGIEAAVSAGVVAAAPERKLEVLTAIESNDRVKITEFKEKCNFEIEELMSEFTFEMKLTGVSGENTAFVHIRERHTNVVSVLLNGGDKTSSYIEEEQEEGEAQTDRGLLNVQDIIDFAEGCSLETIRPLLERQVSMNMDIAEEGLNGDWGASIGKILYNNGSCGLRDKCRAYAAAGSDARMSGCEKPVCILSGSGNQGITASVPVVVYGQSIGADEDDIYRALIVSDLIAIHQKTGIGCLSAYCGAVSAGCGCGCGICFMNGGRYREIAHTLVNSVAILSGTICDGAKPSCAAKIAMAVEAGIMGYEMVCAGTEFYGGDGIVTKGVENTIRNVGKLARDGMSGTDREIIKIMLG